MEWQIEAIHCKWLKCIRNGSNSRIGCIFLIFKYCLAFNFDISYNSNVDFLNLTDIFSNFYNTHKTILCSHSDIYLFEKVVGKARHCEKKGNYQI